MIHDKIDETSQGLCQLAEESALKAYAPYSKFRVGSAVLGKQGTYTGCNIENASYGLTVCAERNALAAAIAAGDQEILAIAVACIDGDFSRHLSEFVPCGACRQVIQELAPNAVIHICGKEVSFVINDLLPKPFTLDESSGG